MTPNSQEQPKPPIGVDRLVYAPILTDDETAGATYSSPIALPGLVEVNETPNADVSVFYADDGVYVQTAQPGQITAALQVANIDAEIKAHLLGSTYDAANGMEVQGQNDVPLPVAVGYRSQLPNGLYEYVWFMNGIFTRVSKTKTTKAESISYVTEPIMFNAQPIKLGAVLKREFSTDDPNAPVGLTDDALKLLVSGWFSDPNIVVVAPGTPVADFATVVGAVLSGDVDAAWTLPTGATAQKIQVLDPVSELWRDAQMLAALISTSIIGTIKDLTPGNDYTFRLVVTSGANNGISNEDDAPAKA